MSIENNELYASFIQKPESPDKEYIKITPGNDQPFYLKAINTLTKENKQIQFSLFQKINHKLNYVEIKATVAGKQQIVLVHVHSLAKCLFLTEEDILKANAEGTLENRLAAWQQSKFVEFDTYSETLSRYEERNGEMVSKSGQVKTGLQRQTLEKILQTAYVTGIIQGKTASINVEKETFIVQKTENQSVQILRIKGSKSLGRGGYGTATKIFNLTTGNMEVLKTARREYVQTSDEGRLPTQTPKNAQKRRFARKDILKEYNNLTRLHQNKPEDLNCFQDCPHSIMPLNGHDKAEKDNHEIGFLGKLYEGGDVADAIKKPDGILKKLSHQERMQVCVEGAYSLTRGLDYLAQIGLMHGDIKPSNIFIDIGSDGKFQFKIGDFGSARFIDDPEMQKVLSGTAKWQNVKTAAYYPFQDEQSSLDLLDRLQKNQLELDTTKRLLKENLRPEEIKKLQDEQISLEAQVSKDIRIFQFLQHQRDVFAMGVSIYEQMTGQLPYELMFNGRPHTIFASFDPSLLQSMGYSQEVCDTLRGMLDADPYKRLKPDEAAERWKAIVQAAPTDIQPKDIPVITSTGPIDAFYAGFSEQLAEAVLQNEKEKPCYLFRPSNIQGFQRISTVSVEPDNRLTFSHYLVKVNQLKKEVAFFDQFNDVEPSRVLNFDQIDATFGRPVVMPKLAT